MIPPNTKYVKIPIGTVVYPIKEGDIPFGIALTKRDWYVDPSNVHDTQGSILLRWYIPLKLELNGFKIVGFKVMEGELQFITNSEL